MTIPSEFDESPVAISMIADELCKLLRAELDIADSEGFGVQEAAVLGYLRNKRGGHASEEELREFVQMIKDAWLNLMIAKGVMCGDIASRWSDEKGCLVFSAGSGLDES